MLATESNLKFRYYKNYQSIQNTPTKILTLSFKLILEMDSFQKSNKFKFALLDIQSVGKKANII